MKYKINYTTQNKKKRRNKKVALFKRESPIHICINY